VLVRRHPATQHVLDSSRSSLSPSVSAALASSRFHDEELHLRGCADMLAVWTGSAN
jgi:hypothetical protein